MTPPTSRLSRALGFDSRHFRDRRFWIVQLLVLILATAHTAVEMLQILPHREAIFFVPEALFLIPVGYAALNFGLHGAVATALWCTALSLPNLFIFHHGTQTAAAATQLLILNAVAFFVGQRVEKETLARREEGASLIALQASEQRFRGLFHNSADGILVFDGTGAIHEANEVAARLFGHERLQGTSLPELIGMEPARSLLAPATWATTGGIVTLFPLERSPGTRSFIEAASTRFTGGDGQPLIQTSLHDVTEQYRRQTELRSYAAGVLRAQEEERRRIAQELHDETLQGVVVVCRQLHEIEEALGDVAPDVRARLQRANDAAEGLMAELRAFTRQLRPAALDELGVVTCIRRVVIDLAAQSGLDATLTVSGPERRLSAELELGLFRIAQEAVRNVERHAEASTLHATLRFATDRVRLSVKDDGKGFELPAPGAWSANGSLGLLGMQERAALLGGDLEIVTGPGRGTAVTANLPA
jgi:PAS domain S-box-containing protein